MAQYEHVLIRGPRSLQEAAGAVADTLSSNAPKPVGEGLAVTVRDTFVGVYDADYEDEPALPPLSPYTYYAHIYGPAQLAVADELYAALAPHGWDLLQLTHDGGRVVATTGELTPA